MTKKASAMPASPESRSPWKLAILISGAGRTLHNLLLAIACGEIDAEIVCVVSSVEGAGGIGIADEYDIPTHVLTRKDAPGTEAYSDALYEIIEPYAPDLVVMAGFLRMLLVREGWEQRILNIHPALLPQALDYAGGKGKYGDKVHEAVLANLDKESGATVHIVTNVFDEGPTLGQSVVPVEDNDNVETLAARVFAAECELYPRVLREYMAAHPELKR